MKEKTAEEPGLLIGIDLGGTNVRAGAFTASGTLLAWQEQPIHAAKGPEPGLETIQQLIHQVRSTSALPLMAIGIGSTGPLDRERGSIQNPYTLPGWEDVDIRSPLVDAFHVPVALENDADAAALGEAWMGAGRGLPRLLMVTVGTGIGTGFVVDGKIYRGLNQEHPEGGHILIDPNGPACYCGAHGCWESLASGPAMAKYASQLLQPGSGYLGRFECAQADEIRAEMIFAGDAAGDPFCRQLVEREGNFLGLGIASILMMILPDAVVLGGGVMHAHERLLPLIESVIDRHSVIIPAKKVQIKTAELGQQAGMYGAARAALNLFKES